MTTKHKAGMDQLSIVAPEVESLRPEEIDFDPNNPRFGNIKNSNTSQVALAERLLGEPYFASELVDSFVENGFIPYEPLIVKKIAGGRYMVIEGNRRLAAVKFIRKAGSGYPASVVSRLDRIPALIFAAEEDRDRIRVYLGIRHLLGFREWPAESKAVFLERESKETPDLSKLLKDVGLKKREARRFLIPYRLFTRVGESVPAGQDFWMLAEAIGRDGVKQYVQLDVDPQTLAIRGVDDVKLKRLFDFIYGRIDKASGERDAATRVVGETRDLSKLAKVLSSKPALRVLADRKNLEEAYLFVDEDEALALKIDKAVAQLKVLMKRLGSVEDVDKRSLKATIGRFEAFVEGYEVLRKTLNG
jgi:hypothetical protein